MKKLTSDSKAMDAKKLVLNVKRLQELSPHEQEGVAGGGLCQHSNECPKTGTSVPTTSG